MGSAMKTGSWRAWVSACILVVFALPGGAAASPVDGAWMIRDLVLNIFDCQHLVCGRIVWIKDPARRPAQCGRTIVWGLEPKTPSSWTGGSILDRITGPFTVYRPLMNGTGCSTPGFSGAPGTAKPIAHRRRRPFGKCTNAAGLPLRDLVRSSTAGTPLPGRPRVPYSLQRRTERDGNNA
jgi:hypothetical protein